MWRIFLAIARHMRTEPEHSPEEADPATREHDPRVGLSMSTTMNKVLILGEGGREHALAWKLAQVGVREAALIWPLFGFRGRDPEMSSVPKPPVLSVWRTSVEQRGFCCLCQGSFHSRGWRRDQGGLGADWGTWRRESHLSGLCLLSPRLDSAPSGL